MTLILELATNREAALKAKAEAEGLTAEQYTQQVLHRDLDRENAQSVSEMFQEIWSDMPDDVRAQRPADGPDQIDLYRITVGKKLA